MRFEFSGIHAKLGRARHHIEQFERRVDAVLEENPKELRMEFDNKTGQFAVYLDHVNALPIDCPFMIGEAVHQMRSALDHLAYVLSGSPTDSKVRRVRFPIYRSLAEFRERSGERAIALMTRRDQAAVKRVQPYRRSNGYPTEDWLWLLDELWNIDKHRTILLAERDIFIRYLRPIPRDGALVDVRYFALDNPVLGTKLVEGIFVPTGPAPKLNVKAKVGVEVFFGKGCGGLSETGPVNVLLRTILDYVRDQVVTEFERKPAQRRPAVKGIVP